jgi:DNA-binding transcriptional LysR family regulator
LNLRRINIFLTVAKHLSYTQAAKELYMSQPAVSKNIQELEQELGARLFNRAGNSIDLTPAGKLVLAYGTDIKRLTQNLQYELGILAEELAGSLHIGASSTIAQYLIPSAIARFKEQYPQVKITLTSGNTAEINGHLKNDIIDLGITEGGRKLNSFSYKAFLDDEIAFISNTANQIAIPQKPVEEALKGIPLVIRETGSGTREVFEKALQKMGVSLSDLNIMMTLGSTESIKSFILDAEAVGVFSVNAVREEEKELFQVDHLPGHRIHRTFSFISKQGSEHKLSREFMRFCKSHYNRSE